MRPPACCRLAGLPSLVWLLALACGPGGAWGQTLPRPTPDLPLLLQELVARPDNEDLNYEDLYENLFQYYQQPLNLNKATSGDLANLYLLSPLQAASLLRHLAENGPLLSVYELQAIPGFDLDTIYKILPFVSVQDPPGLAAGKALGKHIAANPNQYLLGRWDRVLQQRPGYGPADTAASRPAARYAGSPHKYQLRYRNSHSRDFSLGMLVEKDAGERFVWQRATHRYGPDFYSAHLQVYNRGRWQTLALGDYQLQFGQGLLLAGGFQVGKGGETITSLSRSQLGIRPYTSVLETAFFRGLAATYALHPRWHITGFYSRKKADASAPDRSDSLSAETAFGSLSASGLHRTPTEIAGKHRLREQVAGTNLSFRLPQLHLGFNAVYTRYSLAASGSPQLYRQFDFRGQDLLAASLHYTYTWQNVQFFGESARSLPGGWGHVHGLLASLAKNVDFSLLYRRYARSFQSLHGQAFGENTRNNNEQGWYLGLKLRPASRLELTAYYDLYRFAWLRYRVDAPSRGGDYLLRLQFKPSKQVLLYTQLRGEAKGLNVTDDSWQLAQVSPARRHLQVFYLHYAPNETWQWRCRVQRTSYRHEEVSEEGFYIGQELSARGRTWRLTWGYGLFDTGGFNARQYVPESDVLFAFAVPMLHGTGTRTFLLYQQDLSRKTDLWLKAGHALYRNQSTIGSGLDQIDGPEKTEVRCQVRYRF